MFEQQSNGLKRAHVPLDADTRERQPHPLAQRPRRGGDEIETRRDAFQLLRHIAECECHWNARWKRERRAVRIRRPAPRFELVYVMCVVAHAISRRKALTCRARFFERRRWRCGGFEILLEERFIYWVRHAAHSVMKMMRRTAD